MNVAGFPGYLVSNNLLADEIVSKIQNKVQPDGKSFIAVLIEDDIIESKTLARALSQYFNLPFVDLEQYKTANLPLELLGNELIYRYRVLPLVCIDNHLRLAITDPTDTEMLNKIKFYTEMSIQPVVADHKKLNQLIKSLREEKRYSINDALDSPIVKFIDDILKSAIEKNASDVHFEPYEKYYRIRFRIDGLLHEITKVDFNFAERFSARLKVMANLDIAERRLPQDGRFKLRENNYERDCRVSICPTLFGEKIVVRILQTDNINLNINELGMNDRQREIFLHYIHRPEGMILVTGPTGSGKTMSLYSALNILNTDSKNISTVEDPIEINLNGINQVEVNNKIGLTFASVLRTFLRQDPDVIMVGEIRDFDTAEIAIKAAQTGHLVLATLHTNSAAEAITRLLNMGILAFNLSSSINLILAQRLVRKLCPYCKQQVISDGKTVYCAVGCEQCYQGYKGRTGIFEVMPFTSKLSEILLKSQNAIEIAKQAKSDGLETLHDMALCNVADGITSLEEINRVV